jgi:UPF0176 protein
MEAATPLLFSYRRCPYAIRARLALAYAKVGVQFHEVSLRDKPAQMLAVSPKGTVPVLVLPSGQVLEQSLDIMRWALLQHDPDDWLYAQADTNNPSPTHAQQQAELWLARNDGAFKRALDAYKYPERHFDKSQAEHRFDALKALIEPLEKQLSNNAYVLGARVSYVDAALVPFVRQFAAVDRSWFDDEGTQSFPHVMRWLQGWLASSLFETVMAKPATLSKTSH